MIMSWATILDKDRPMILTYSQTDTNTYVSASVRELIFEGAFLLTKLHMSFNFMMGIKLHFWIVIFLLIHQ